MFISVFYILFFVLLFAEGFKEEGTTVLEDVPCFPRYLETGLCEIFGLPP